MRVVAAAVPLERRALDEQDVLPAVVVVVEKGGAATLGFEDVSLLVFRTVDVVEADSRRRCDVRELRDRPFGRGARGQ